MICITKTANTTLPIHGYNCTKLPMGQTLWAEYIVELFKKNAPQTASLRPRTGGVDQTDEQASC